MITFKTHLDESLTSGYPVRHYLGRSGTFASFDFVDRDGTTFDISFERQNIYGDYHTLWVEFRAQLKGSTDLTQHATGKGTDPLRVYGTIGRELKSYISEYPANQITFASADPKTNKLYTALAKRIARDVHGRVAMDDGHGFVKVMID